MNEPTLYTVVPSPLGELMLVGNGEALRGVYITNQSNPAWQRDDAGFREARKQLQAYFAGDLLDFNLPLTPEGSAFQKRVWEILRGIPFGTSISYGEQARRLGQPSAARAVGAANGRNPLPIIVPCHRVIGANGSLVGYAGGLAIKQWLLRHEAEVLDKRGSLAG